MYSGTQVYEHPDTKAWFDIRALNIRTASKSGHSISRLLQNPDIKFPDFEAYVDIIRYPDTRYPDSEFDSKSGLRKPWYPGSKLLMVKQACFVI